MSIMKLWEQSKDMILAPVSNKAASNTFAQMRSVMSDTEWIALTSGTIGFEKSIFAGKPDWDGLFATPEPGLTDKEQAFLDNEVEGLCQILDDYQIRNEIHDLPVEAYDYLKEHRFFGMIIPEKYGGLGFSAQMHSAVVAKISSRSSAAAATAMVPNSLGPAELLMAYGTEEERQYWLPKLAVGEEIPCFSLTSPDAGSDATSLNDTGVLYKDAETGEININMNWEKRYITLAPIATIMGMAIRLKDPEGLLPEYLRQNYAEDEIPPRLLEGKEDLGITVALVPGDTPGITKGFRHHPMGSPFVNGPHWGKDVKVPISSILGGAKNAGLGWNMLTAQLAVGRSISLPASASGSARYLSRVTGAYSVVRKQFGMSIGHMQGVEQKLASIAGRNYIIDSARTLPLQDLDLAHAAGKEAKPAVASAMLKYRTTTDAETAAHDSVWVHGGKAVMEGPNNPVSHVYTGIQVGVAVEGHNILTRDMITLGQGSILTHKYAFPGLVSADTNGDIDSAIEILKKRDDSIDDPKAEKKMRKALQSPSKLIRGHLGLVFKNAVRSFTRNLTKGRLHSLPKDLKVKNGPDKRYYQHIDRVSSAFSFLTNASMLALQAGLKREGSYAGALADAGSSLYMASQVLRRWELDGRKKDDVPLMQWACDHLLNDAESKMSEAIDNFPNTPLVPKFARGLTKTFLRAVVLPRGVQVKTPSYRLNSKVARVITTPGEARDRLTNGMFIPTDKYDYITRLEDAFEKAVQAAPLERKVAKAGKKGEIDGTRNAAGMIAEALEKGVINQEEAVFLREVDRNRHDIIGADSFDPDDWNQPVNPGGLPILNPAHQ